MLPDNLVSQVSKELSLNPRQVVQTLALFDEGNTLPFIARYRKEVTGGLDEVQLREVRERAEYLAELEERRAAVIESIHGQGKLDEMLRGKIEAAETKQELEDLYLPFKPKRRTRATIARERGLEPLAELIWGGEADDDAVDAAAAGFVNEESGVPSAAEALKGARDILAERIAEEARLRGYVRDATRERGVVRSRAAYGKENEVSKFQDYYDFEQKLTEIPSHRILAIRRGEEEGLLAWSIVGPTEEILPLLEAELVAPRRARREMALVVQDALKRLIAPAIEVELRLELKTRADEEAIGIFGRNLEQLLLAPPAGERATIGLDPGFRTGVKVAVVSRTGALIDTDTLFLHQTERFAAALEHLIRKHRPELIAIGNGTASRETEAAARSVVRALDEPRPQVVVVNEAGASVYSASDLAREEFPDLDVSLRGAVSIARRLQDPLAELVKIDPKAIGVGQYQHDVNQTRLKKRLDEVVESSVNRVGVELNTASAALLSYVAGIGPSLAQNIVRSRDERGGFRSRRDLLSVPRLGSKAFEQSAGFLRVRGGEHALDATAVHPERYGLVELMATDLGAPLADLLSNDVLLERLDLDRYVSDDVGRPTLQDILGELRKPGRDPRDVFEPPAFREDVLEPKDLQPGMKLEGVVTNIVAFGAFVDVGVHLDGLVHVSQLADRYVADPNNVVKVGQRVKVTVMSVDLERQRIALSMKSQPGAPASGARPGGKQKGESRKDAGKPKSYKPGEYAPNGMRFR